jgi:hypothetical protein
MKKNLLDPTAAAEIIQRAKRLNSSLQATWGVMNPAEMLHHCSAAIKATLEGKTAATPSSLKQKVLKFVFLRIASQFPKNVQAPKKIDIKKSSIPTADFQTELNQFISLVNDFATNKQPLAAAHPVFGKLSNKQWGVFTWMHLDHHLRQFNV